MSNRYSLSQTDSPRPTYRVIDHAQDGEVARYPSNLPSGAPHPRAGQPVSVVPGERRPRTWSEVGGRTVAVIERVPDWASVPRSLLLREDLRGLHGIPVDLLAQGGLSVRPWYVSPVSWDDVPGGRRPATLPDIHPHQQRRWQDRYTTATARSTSPRRLLDVLNRRAAREAA